MCARLPSPLRERFAPHPFAGVLDGHQWVLTLAAHTDRHAAQIEEIRGRKTGEVGR